jgi:hypothetical protein
LQEGRPENYGTVRHSLTEEEIAYYLGLLHEELCGYDCGQLCKDENGVPLCCVVEGAVPLLYKTELSYLEKQGRLWSRFIPKTKEDKELVKTADTDQVFAECRGVSHCIRSQRSICCRTFPLEPYLDKRNVFVGLTFMEEFRKPDKKTGKPKCPMTLRAADIRQQFIDAHFIFWEKLMFRRREEYDTYIGTSRKARTVRKKTGQDFPVLLPSHHKKRRDISENLF